MMKRLLSAIIVAVCVSSACEKLPTGEIFKANMLSINDSEPVEYETGGLASLLEGKEVTKLVWTTISKMGAVDVMALRGVKGTLEYADMLNVRFVDDGSTYDGYSSDEERINPELIPQDLFISFKALRTVILPDKAKGLGSRALSGCDRLVSCTLPPSLEYMQRYCFHGCLDLPEIKLPDKLKELRQDSNFWDCDSFVSFTFPDSVTDPGDQTLEECDNLKNLYIGAGCLPEHLNQRLVKGCYKLESIKVSSGNPQIVQDGDALVTADRKTLLMQSPACPSGKYVVKGYPSNKMSFFGNPYTSIEFAEGCETIEYCYFHSCTNLTVLIFPSTLKKIIRNHPANNWNDKLQTIIVRSETPPSVDPAFLQTVGPFTEILVPSGAVSAYKAADGWKDYADKVRAE